MDPETSNSFSKDIIDSLLYAVGLLSAIWVSGRKIGTVEANVKKDITHQSEANTRLTGAVTKLANKVDELEKRDCVEEDVVKEILGRGFLTRLELDKEQTICRRERNLEFQIIEERTETKFKELTIGQEYIRSAVSEHAMAVNNIASELKGLREAILASGVEQKTRNQMKERRDD